MQRFSQYLLLLTLIVAPLCVGSYFDIWRWPALILASGAILLNITSNLYSTYLKPSQKLSQHSKNSASLLLGSLILLIILQGGWMWYNAWGEFSTNPWFIAKLNSQPAPSLPGAPDRTEAWDRLSYIIPCLGIIWITQRIVFHHPSWKDKIAKTIFATGVAVALLGLAQKWSGAEGIYWNDKLSLPGLSLFFGTYRSPGIAASYLNLSLIMGLSVLIAPKTKRQQQETSSSPKLRSTSLAWGLLKIFGILIVLTGVFSSASKAGMIFSLLTLALWGGFNYRTIKHAIRQGTSTFQGNRIMERNIAAGTILITAILAILSFSNTLTERWNSATEGGYSTVAERGYVNSVQFDMLQDKEWGLLGFGPGSFYPLFRYYQDESEITGTYVYAHNDFLQTLIEWGILGTSLFIILIGTGFYFLLRALFFQKNHFSKNDIVYFRGFVIAMLIMLLHSTVDFPFQIESIAITFSVLLGASWGTHPYKK